MYWLLSVLLFTSHLAGMEAVFTDDRFVLEVSPPTGTADKPEVHIVYMGGVSELVTTNHIDAHLGMLSSVLGSMQAAKDSILYSYTKSFNGFAAVMTESDAENLRGMLGVVSVFKQQMTKRPQTTASWTQFLGLSPTEGIWSQTHFGSGTIVGLLDTGIWPEHPSFSDEGFGQIPSRWKGSCEKGEQFSPHDCNKKLIGAKYFSKGYGPVFPPEIDSARDTDGHGTHTSSTAAGNRVANASLLGVASGTASGGAPSARLAMYKVCWGEGCADADLLAGFEAAIADGVDILSVSIGGPAIDYQLDSIAIGSFHAVEKGILVACAGGNDGPFAGSVGNTAPWIFTVAASSIDRVYESDVQLLADGQKTKTVPGAAINTADTTKPYPLVYGGDIGDEFCENVDPRKAEGKIVVCNSPDGLDGNSSLVFDDGAKGYISIVDDLSVQFYQSNVSNTNVDLTAGTEILKWINSTKDPKAIIEKTIAVYNTTPAPIIAYFSSVGPNPITPDMLKPDISAPGVDILAAWAPDIQADYPGDYPFPIWNIISGTSMATPHTAGTAALVKSAHPDWSPAAIKSAIMTTATRFNTSNSANYELASGAGQINPNKAADPGLIFDLQTSDYINFLCAIGYNSTSVHLVSGGKQTCPPTNTTVIDMNLPTIYISSNISVGSAFNITRTVTSVGSPSCTYCVTVEAPVGVDVTVTPTTLEFSALNEKQSFSVVAVITDTIVGYNFGSITWSDNEGHSVNMVIGAGQEGVEVLFR